MTSRLIRKNGTRAKNVIFLYILLGMLAVDHFTKILSFYCLDNEEYEYVISNLLWVERHINPKYFEHLQIANVDILTNYEYWHRLSSMILIPLLLGLYLYTKHIEITKHRKYLLGVFLIMVYLLFVGQLESMLTAIEPNKVLLLFIVVTLGNVILPLGLFIVTDTYFKVLILLASA